MTGENKPESAIEKRNEFAYWAIPGAATAVTYSLPLFHEIDFAVNEGYRKIPHGGIEEGGLLFGKIDAKGTRVEAFRPIVCEHASGPSFLLSDHDLEELRAQIEGAASDADLESLELVGWFLAHTRGPLTLTDREMDLCDQYFGQPGMLTVLVKPERFQPTRFGFLVRGEDGSLPRDGVQNAIILPLPGRSANAVSRPVASIPAPTVKAPASDAEEELPAPSEPMTDTKPSIAGVSSADVAAAPAAANRTVRRQRRLKEEEETRSAAANEAAGPDVPDEPADVPLTAPLTRTGRGEIERLRRGGFMGASAGSAMALHASSHEVEEMEGEPDAYRQMELLNQKKPVSTTARLVMVLPLAALLGCLVGYVAYLQVPSPIIPLSVKSRGENVVVTWPAEQTRSAVYAAVRVDDSTPVMLTPEEKTTGRVEVQARPDMKVELIARNWIHDSRGIVHFVKPVANTSP
jgi:hypothetical protein